MLDLFSKLPQGDFTIPLYFDYVATFTWALSGAIVGARMRYDITGVFVIALVSSMGGSLLRDSIFLQRTPPILTNGTYLMLVLAATLLISLVARRIIRVPKSVSIDRVVDLIDAVGIPAFAIVGMQLAMAQQVSLPGVILVGVVNGVGGGLLRDVISRREPLLLQPGQFSTLIVLLACVAYVLLTRWVGLDGTRTGLATVVLFFAVRAITIRFNWRTHAVLHEDQA